MLTPLPCRLLFPESTAFMFRASSILSVLRGWLLLHIYVCDPRATATDEDSLTEDKQDSTKSQEQPMVQSNPSLIFQLKFPFPFPIKQGHYLPSATYNKFRQKSSNDRYTHISICPSPSRIAQKEQLKLPKRQNTQKKD